jgi:hypothetical protein
MCAHTQSFMDVVKEHSEPLDLNQKLEILPPRGSQIKAVDPSSIQTKQETQISKTDRSGDISSLHDWREGKGSWVCWTTSNELRSPPQQIISDPKSTKVDTVWYDVRKGNLSCIFQWGGAVPLVSDKAGLDLCEPQCQVLLGY